jgi:hypothetical protein
VFTFEQTRQSAGLYCETLFKNARGSDPCLPGNTKSGQTAADIIALVELDMKKMRLRFVWRVRRSENDCENWNTPKTVTGKFSYRRRLRTENEAIRYRPIRKPWQKWSAPLVRDADCRFIVRCSTSFCTIEYIPSATPIDEVSDKPVTTQTSETSGPLKRCGGDWDAE